MIITESGTHRLTADVDDRILIAASNVTLIGAGFTVRNPPPPATEANPEPYSEGISFAPGIRETQIEDIKVTGCSCGINTNGTYQPFLVDVDLSGNLRYGAQLSGGQAATVRRVICRNIGGAEGRNAYAIGINGIGHGGKVERSVFSDIYRQVAGLDAGEGLAVLVEDGAQGVTIEGNDYRNTRREPNTLGFWWAQHTQGRQISNRLHNISRPWAIAGAVVEEDNVYTFDPVDGGLVEPPPTRVFVGGKWWSATWAEMDPQP